MPDIKNVTLHEIQLDTSVLSAIIQVRQDITVSGVVLVGGARDETGIDPKLSQSGEMLS